MASCATISCKEHKVTPYDFTKEAILGKWEIIEIGNWPVMKPCQANGFKEYTQDGIVRVFEYDYNNYTSQRNYWIDSLLHESITTQDGFELVFDYNYQFFEDKLRLDAKAFMIYNTTIYKQIN